MQKVTAATAAAAAAWHQDVQPIRCEKQCRWRPSAVVRTAHYFRAGDIPADAGFNCTVIACETYVTTFFHFIFFM